MGLKQIDLNTPAPPIEWLVPELLPLGHLSFFGGLGGTFKTATTAYLMVQMARPEGRGKFLGRPVMHGASIFLNFDNAGAESQGFRYWLEPALKAFPDANKGLIRVFEPDSNTFELAMDDILEAIIGTDGLKLVALDSFEACFPSVNPIRGDSVRQALGPLERMAAGLGLSVLVVDHLPKPAMAELPEHRSLKGNGAKRNAARAVHLFSKLPPEKTQGNVYRWAVDKMSFGPPIPPFGVRVELTKEALHLTEVDLPEDNRPSRLEAAIAAIVNHFDTNPGAVLNRQELLEVAKAQGLGDTKAKQALVAALERVEPEEVALGGRGNPVGYRLPSPYYLDEVTKINNHVPDSADLGFGKVTQIPGVTQIPTPQDPLQAAWHLIPRLPDEEQPHWRLRLNREREKAALELLAQYQC